MVKAYLILHKHGTKTEKFPRIGYQEVIDEDSSIEFYFDAEAVMAFEDNKIIDYNGKEYCCIETKDTILNQLILHYKQI